MPKPTAPTEVLTIRVPRTLGRRLAQEARKQRRTRSEVARDLIAAALGDAPDDPYAEARRQSLLVRERESEQEALRFIVDSADLRGWK
jgi:predicted transcriptional regulator